MTEVASRCERCRHYPASIDTLIGRFCDDCLEAFAPPCPYCHERMWAGERSCVRCRPTLVQTMCSSRVPRSRAVKRGPYLYCDAATQREFRRCGCYDVTHCARCRTSLDPFAHEDGWNLCTYDNEHIFCPRCVPPSDTTCTCCGVHGGPNGNFAVRLVEHIAADGLTVTHRDQTMCAMCAGAPLQCQKCLTVFGHRSQVFYVDQEADIEILRQWLTTRDPHERPAGASLFYSDQLQFGLCPDCAEVCAQCHRLAVLTADGVCRFCYKYNHQLY